MPDCNFLVSYYDYMSHNLRDWLIAGGEGKADLSKVPADMQTSDYSLKHLIFD